MHMYDVVGSHKERDELSYGAERITSFDDKQKYMTLCGTQQEGPSEYQEPQQCTRNTRATVNNDQVKGPSDCQALKDQLKQMKRCLCVLSFLVVIIFLITISSISLAAYYGFSSIRSSAAVNNLEHQLNMINLEVVSQRSFVDTLESQFNITNAEIISQRTFINTLSSQLNRIDLEISTLPSVRSSITSLQSQLNNIMNISSQSLQIAIASRNQPRK